MGVPQRRAQSAIVMREQKEQTPRAIARSIECGNRSDVSVFVLTKIWIHVLNELSLEFLRNAKDINSSWQINLSINRTFF